MTQLTKTGQKSLDTFYDGAMLKDVTQIRQALTDDFMFKNLVRNHDNSNAFAKPLLGFDGTVSDSRMISDGNHLVHLFTIDIGVKTPMCDAIEFKRDRLCSMVT